MKVAISGAGISGPTLAYWLERLGCEAVLIEESAQPRSGGYIIDFWGVGYDVAEKMGLRPRLHELGYHVKELRFVDGQGNTSGGFSTAFFARSLRGRFVSLQRSDLASAIYEALGRTQTMFGQTITRIEEYGRGVRVFLSNAEPLICDLVIGADGLHSRVRELLFGPEKEYEAKLGYCVAAFELERYRPRDELVYSSYPQPGRQVSRFSLRDDKTLALFVFKDTNIGPFPHNDEQRRAALRRIFGHDAWECPRLLDAMEDTHGIYFDRVSQIRMPHWSRGRAALVGDAAACVSLLAGDGSSLAMAEAYILAGEIVRCRGDHASAFASYERQLMGFIRSKQQTAVRFASSFVPSTSFGIAARNFATKLMSVPLLADQLLGRNLRDDFVLPAYPGECLTTAATPRGAPLRSS